MGVRLSYDNGKSWSKSKVVWAGPAAYGDLARIGDDSAIMMFENGDTGFAQRISDIYTAALSCPARSLAKTAAYISCSQCPT